MQGCFKGIVIGAHHYTERGSQYGQIQRQGMPNNQPSDIH